MRSLAPTDAHIVIRVGGYAAIVSRIRTTDAIVASIRVLIGIGGIGNARSAGKRPVVARDDMQARIGLVANVNVIDNVNGADNAQQHQCHRQHSGEHVLYA